MDTGRTSIGRTDIMGAETEAQNQITLLSDVACPQLLLFRPDDKPNRPTVLVCPGGGYSVLANDLEGAEVAWWLNTLGFDAAVLHYRVPDKREGAFQDAQRAMSLLRANSNQIGVMGFSAGGHLAARLATHFNKRAYEAQDTVDFVSCRPDFAMLVYPAFLIENGQAVAEVQPQANTPPVFITQTRDDGHFCALDYAAALENAGVPTKCVIYETGGHGYGVRLGPEQPARAWMTEAAAWLANQTDA